MASISLIVIIRIDCTATNRDWQHSASRAIYNDIHIIHYHRCTYRGGTRVRSLLFHGSHLFVSNPTLDLLAGTQALSSDSYLYRQISCTSSLCMFSFSISFSSIFLFFSSHLFLTSPIRRPSSSSKYQLVIYLYLYLSLFFYLYFYLYLNLYLYLYVIFYLPQCICLSVLPPCVCL